MPLRLEIKSKLAQRSERVKSVDLHPTEPWIRVSLYSGSVGIWDYQSQVLEVIGEEEGHREADEVDADESTDGDVLVNRDNDDEEYGTSNEGNLRA